MGWIAPSVVLNYGLDSNQGGFELWAGLDSPKVGYELWAG